MTKARKLTAKLTATEAADTASFAAQKGLEFKIRLPVDVAERIRTKAEKEGRAQNKIIVAELSDYPRLKDSGALTEKIRDMDVLLARYGSRITGIELSESLLAAIDLVLKAESFDVLQAAVDRLRVEHRRMVGGRAAMLDAASRISKSGT
jgi:hypothetical protein